MLRSSCQLQFSWCPHKSLHKQTAILSTSKFSTKFWFFHNSHNALFLSNAELSATIELRHKIPRDQTWAISGSQHQVRQRVRTRACGCDWPTRTWFNLSTRWHKISNTSDPGKVIQGRWLLGETVKCSENCTNGISVYSNWALSMLALLKEFSSCQDWYPPTITKHLCSCNPTDTGAWS